MTEAIEGNGPTGPLVPHTTMRLLGRAMRRRCPVCGMRGLFRHWFRIVERCPRCNFRLEERIEGHWIGALGMNIIVSFGVLLITMVIALVLAYPDFPIAPLLATTVTVALFMPLFFYPYSKTLWSAIDLAMRPLEPDDDVDPRWIPPPVHRPER